MNEIIPGTSLDNIGCKSSEGRKTKLNIINPLGILTGVVSKIGTDITRDQHNTSENNEETNIVSKVVKFVKNVFDKNKITPNSEASLNMSTSPGDVARNDEVVDTYGVTSVKSTDLSLDLSLDLTTYIRCIFHDFRGPLNNISLGIDVLLDNNNDKTNSEILKNIQSSCTFICESLDGFLNIESITDNNKNNIDCKINNEPFNIIGMINKIQYMFLFKYLKKKINIKYNIIKVKEWVIGDYKNIQHVILNLLSNAINFSNDGSTIILQLENIKLADSKQHIVISVIDENEHIDENIKKHLFKKYNTSDNVKGTGLGLYICKNIIEMNGGKINHFNNNNLLGFVGNTDFTKDKKRGNIFQIELFLDVCRSTDKNMNLLVAINSRSSSFGSRGGAHKSEVDGARKREVDETYGVTLVNPYEIVSTVKNNKGAKFDMNDYNEKEECNPSNTSQLLQKRGSSNCIRLKTIEDSSVNNNIIMKKESTVSNIFSDSKDNDSVNIMVIDDSEMSRKLLIRLIKGNCENVNVYDALDGLDALIKIVQFKEQNKHKIGMIMVDNVMPNLTGELLCKILRGIGYSGLIIGITGNGLTEDKNKFIENGADFVFIKPFTKNNLVKLVSFIKNNGYDSINSLKIEEEYGELIWK